MRHTNIILMTSDDSRCASHGFDRRGHEPGHTVRQPVRVTLGVHRQNQRFSCSRLTLCVRGGRISNPRRQPINDIDQRVIKLLAGALVVETSSN